MTALFETQSNDRDGFVAALFDELARHGDTLYDIGVTQLEHALQCARLASVEGAAEAEIVAALLHDIGHLLAGEHRGRPDFLAWDLHHEMLGANWLLPRFGEKVAEPVRLHVAAKRYLCATDQVYWESLSSASKRSLQIQGGPMTESEAEAFGKLPAATAAVSLRKRDDRAKIAGLSVPALWTYSSLVREQLLG